MAVLGSLSVKLGLVTVDWDRATDQAKKQAQDLQSAFNGIGKELGGLSSVFRTFGGVVGITSLGLGALGASSLSYANDVKDLSDGFDISVQKTLQFRDAIERSGGSADGASKMLSKLFDTINQAKEGKPAAIKLFEDIGITWQELNSLSPEKSIDRVMGALANGSADTFKRVSELKQIMGKQGIGLDIQNVSDIVSQSTKEFDSAADSVKKVGDFSDSTKKTMDNLKLAMIELMAPFSNKDNVVGIETFKMALLAVGGIAVVSGIRSLASAILFLNSTLVGLEVTGGTLSLTMTPLLALITGYATQFATFATGILGTTAAIIASTATLGAWLALHSGELNGGEDAWLADQQKQRDAKKGAGGTTTGEVKDTPSVMALKAKISMTQELMKLESNSADLKARAFTLDEYSVKNAEIGLELAKEKAKAANDYAQYIGAGEKRTAEETTAAQGVRDADIASATSKAANARKVLEAQQARETSVYKMQSALKKEMAKIDIASLELGYQHQFISDYDFNVAKEQLTTQGKILTIREQIKELNQGSDAAGRAHYKEVKSVLDQQIVDEQTASNKRIEILGAEEVRRVEILNMQANLKKQLAQLDLDGLDLAHQKNWMSDYDYNVADERLNTEKKMLALKEQLAEIPQGTDAQSISHYNELSKVIEDEMAVEQTASDKRLELFAIDELNRESFSYGWQQAWFQYQKNASDASAKGAEAFASVMGDMTSALNTFVDTGKINFSSLASSIIKDLIKMQLQAQMTSLFSSMGGLGGILGSAPIGSAGTGSGILGAISGIFSPHANGGSFGAGSPIMVGEKGPELMIPSRAGSIVPTASLSSTMGGQQQTVYNGTVIQNMSAIDTQSGVQFLAKNKSAIFAANQSAMRSLPQSR